MMPRKRPCTRCRAGAPSGFNEAGAMMPRKSRRRRRPGATSRAGFNEAGAMMPRKSAPADDPEIGSGRFNEAGAMMPRKSRSSKSAGGMWPGSLQ